MRSESLRIYRDEVIPFFLERDEISNLHQVPSLEKLVVTTSVGSQVDRKQAVEDAIVDITKIAGQKPVVNYAKKSVANFKLRAGEPLGARVTLRGQRMWEFFDRFVYLVAPNIRDFRGFSQRSFDGRGNYSVGIQDQSVFPEIDLENIKRNIGFDIIFVTTANTNEEGFLLLEKLKIPFRKK